LDSSISIGSRLHVGQPESCGSIPGRGDLYLLQCPDQLLESPRRMYELCKYIILGKYTTVKKLNVYSMQAFAIF
jgi:hypothetical protein